MRKYNIEMCYSVGFSLCGVEAENEMEAIRKAQKLIEKGTTLITEDSSIDSRDLEFEQVTFIQEEK